MIFLILEIPLVIIFLFLMRVYPTEQYHKDENVFISYINYTDKNIYKLDKSANFKNLTEMLHYNRDAMNNSIDDTKTILSIKSFDDIDTVVEDITNLGVDTCSNWVRCYILYSTYNWIEGCIDESSEEYWHMKYVTNQDVGKYNYAILIKYKWFGFFILNYYTIMVILIAIILFLWVAYWLFFIRDMLKTKIKI